MLSCLPYAPEASKHRPPCQQLVLQREPLWLKNDGDRQNCERRPLVWMDVQGREEAPNKSYINAAEVNSCLKVVTRLRERIGIRPWFFTWRRILEKYFDGSPLSTAKFQFGRFTRPKPSVALLTFYKGQLEELMKAVPSDLDVEVLTVDACQGSEFDFVILSTVRANRDLRLGFVKDAQRICVATSRSRLQLFIVGHRQTLCADGDWKQVYEACTAATPEDARPQRPSPAAGFVSVFDALRRAKELDAEQKALQAMEEQSKDPGRRPSRPSSGAESLMWQQASFRNQASQPSILRRNDGTYQSSTAVAIGSGYRSRRDVYAMEATAKAHLQSLEVPRPAFAAVAPKATDYSQFPELSGRPEASGQKAPMPRCQLRPSTRNDERRARRAAQKASSSEMEVAQPPLSMEATGGTEQVWEDVHEAVLFEMFPEETPAVEEALLRFAGTPHQAARALEALLARPEAKAMAEGEDDLDYDRASFADEDGPVDWEDEEEWDEDAEDEWEEEEEEWDEYAEEEQVIPTAEAPEVPKPVRRWGNQARQENVFGSLDGAPKWAEMPARPEQGGKELVPLAPPRRSGVQRTCWSRKGDVRSSKIQLLLAPTLRQPVRKVGQTGAVSCSQESIIDYLASMMGECLQESFVGRVWGKDEVDELHETVVEILQDAENLWQKLKT
ncbi:HCS1 [Symbiodinium sp. KB8]|nr:HCS1 [Symbiodinium sp. KB8]